MAVEAEIRSEIAAMWKTEDGRRINDVAKSRNLKGSLVNGSSVLILERDRFQQRRNQIIGGIWLKLRWQSVRKLWNRVKLPLTAEWIAPPPPLGGAPPPGGKSPDSFVHCVYHSLMVRVLFPAFIFSLKLYDRTLH